MSFVVSSPLATFNQGGYIGTNGWTNNQAEIPLPISRTKKLGSIVSPYGSAGAFHLSDDLATVTFTRDSGGINANVYWLAFGV